MDRNFLKYPKATQERKARAFRELFQNFLLAATPHGGTSLLINMVMKFEDQRSRERKPSELAEVLDGFAQKFDTCPSSAIMMHDLSYITPNFRQKDLQKYIPNLSSHYFKQSRAMAVYYSETIVPCVKPKQVRQRYCQESVQYLLNYLVSPEVSTELPMYCRTRKTSDGQEHQLPLLLRDKNKCSIAYNYLNYCDETDHADMKMSQSQIMRVLKWAPGVTRKCLAGLDYITHAGNVAIDDLTELSKRLLILIGDPKWAADTQKSLEAVRQYLRHDYVIHTQQDSQFFDHNTKYALSDPDNPLLSAKLTYEVKLACDRCNNMRILFDEIERTIEVADHRDDMDKARDKWIFEHAKTDIYEWKAHQVRTVHQNKGRAEIIENLQENEAHLTIDYASKWLPLSYEESQREFYGKQGVLWHIGVAQRRQPTTGETSFRKFSTFYRNIGSASSQSTTATIHDVITRMKVEMPTLQTVYLSSDNTRYYHGSATISTIPTISKQTGVFIKRWDFSEVQSGKSNCDRTASHVKGSARMYVAQKNYARNAQEFWKAAGSYKDGIPGTTFVLADLSPIVEKTPDQKPKIKDISKYNNFEFSNDNGPIRAWRAYGVGEGVLLPNDWQGKHNTESFIQDTLESYSVKWEEREPDTPKNPTVVGDIWHNRGKEKAKKPVKSCGKPSDDDFDDSATTRHGLYMCPIAGCTKFFLRHGNLECHLDVGNHEMHLEKQTLRDYVITQYPLACENSGLTTLLRPLDRAICTVAQGKDVQQFEPLETGWSFKKDKKRAVPMSLNVRNYLIHKFNEGIDSGRKHRSTDIARVMRTEFNKKNKPMFSIDEYRTAIQIERFWHHLSATHHDENVLPLTDETLADSIRAEEVEDEKHGYEETIRATVVEELDDNDSLTDALKLIKITEEHHMGKKKQQTKDVDAEPAEEESVPDAPAESGGRSAEFEETARDVDDDDGGPEDHDCPCPPDVGQQNVIFSLGDIVLMKRSKGDQSKTRQKYQIVKILTDTTFMVMNLKTKRELKTPARASQLEHVAFGGEDETCPDQSEEQVRDTAMITAAPIQWWVEQLDLQQRDRAKLIEPTELVADEIVNAIHKLISAQTGQKYQPVALSNANAGSTFAAVNGPNHIQILHDHPRGHWVLSVFTYDGKVQLADSLGRKLDGSFFPLSNHIIAQLKNLYPQALDDNGLLEVELLPVQQQTEQDRSNMIDCGFFAIANAIEVYRRYSPMTASYDNTNNRMRKHLIEMLPKRQLYRFSQVENADRELENISVVVV